MNEREYNSKEYITILSDMDLVFTPGEMEDFIYLWNEGHSLNDIYKFLRGRNGLRTQDEVGLLLYHLSRQKKVKSRPNGIHDNTKYMGGEETV